MKSKNNPYGDDAGTRVGRSSNAQEGSSQSAKGGKGSNKDTSKGSNKTFGSGQEATQGSRGAGGRQNAPGKTSDSPRVTPKDQHTSGYGGDKGNPKRSSDQR